MFENRRMPNGTSEPSLGLRGVGGRACEGSLYPIVRLWSDAYEHEVPNAVAESFASGLELGAGALTQRIGHHR